ncbi:MAG: radical SAM protein [Firmicutes bacterium]|nr:radical SAM protein [Bacillota bacterium]
MKTYNIPIFVPHRGCPFDCVFCNQNRITGEQKEVTADDVREIISEYLKTLPKTNRKIEAAFFGGSFTGIPFEEQTSLLSAAYEFVQKGLIDGIRLSTRPDYIDKKILDNLMRYGVTTIELGVQSMDNGVLKASNRGHTSAQVIDAVRMIREYPFNLGLQMMTGLPGDTDEKSLYTADEIIKLKPDMVRIYPTLTIKDTFLEKMYTAGQYRPQTLDEAVSLSKKLLLKFEGNNITVIRVGLQSTDEISEGGSVVAGPVHSAFGELAESSIYYDIICAALKNTACKKAEVFVNPKEMSKAVGNKRANIIKIKNEKNIDIKIRADESLKKREVRCVCC